MKNLRMKSDFLFISVNGKTFTLNRPLEPILTAPTSQEEARNNHNSTSPPPGDMPKHSEDAGGYMPGMGEKKKKKGIFGLFSRKKDGKFKVVCIHWLVDSFYY